MIWGKGREGRKGKGRGGNGEICVVLALPVYSSTGRCFVRWGRVWGDDDGWIDGGRFAVECSVLYDTVAILLLVRLEWGGRAGFSIIVLEQHTIAGMRA